MTPHIPNDPDELRRVSDALLASAIPDDITQTDSVLDVVELIAREILKLAIENADDPDTLRPEVRLAAVRLLNLGDDPRDDGDRNLGAVSMNEFAVVRTEVAEALRRVNPIDRREYIAAIRTIGENAHPIGVIVLLGGVCPPEAGDQAGEPFVIIAHALRRDSGEVATSSMTHEHALECEDIPSDIRASVEALLEVGKRAARD